VNRQETRLAAGGIMLVFAFVVVGARAQSVRPPGLTAGADAPKRADKQFKNIQALKGIPANQLIPSMQFIAASLGVECDYCHVEHAF
jgi:hypothetical protein